MTTKERSCEIMNCATCLLQLFSFHFLGFILFLGRSTFMAETKLNNLRPDVVAKVSFEFRLFAPTVVANLPCKSGTWSKWICTVIDAHGQTAQLRRSFFGANQEAQVKSFASKYAHGSCWSVNPDRKPGLGLKGVKSDKRYTSTTSPVELEVLDKTLLSALGEDRSALIPQWPPIRMALSEVLSKDTESRVDLLGILPALGFRCHRKSFLQYVTVLENCFVAKLFCCKTVLLHRVFFW